MCIHSHFLLQIFSTLILNISYIWIKTCLIPGWNPLFKNKSKVLPLCFTFMFVQLVLYEFYTTSSHLKGKLKMFTLISIFIEDTCTFVADESYDWDFGIKLTLFTFYESDANVSLVLFSKFILESFPYLITISIKSCSK